jgi:DNA replication protein DnaC
VSQPIYAEFKQYEWRRRVFTPSDINDLKRELVQMMKEAFYQADGKIILSDDDKEVLRLVFNWLIGMDVDIKLNKGLLLTGSFGTGKSIVLKGIIQFIEKYYSINSLDKGISEPLYVLSHDMANHFASENEYLINRMRNTSILAIDDIGYEAKVVKNYGTEIKPFEEIIMSRYDKKKNILISTNLTLDQIGTEYGWHIYDRLKQMTYVVPFKGESKRK